MINRYGSLLVKLMFLILLALFLFFSYRGEGAKDIKLDGLEKTMNEAKLMGKMTKATDRQLMQFFGLDHTSFDSYFYYRDETALSVDELLVIKLKSTSQAQSVQDSIDKRIKAQIKAFEGYGPDQVSALKNSITIVRGPMVFFTCGPNSDKLRGVFVDAI